MKRTQEQIILDYLQDKGGWVREGEITGLETPRGEWIGYDGPRATRRLIHEGKVEHRMDGKYRVVRYKVAPKRISITAGNWAIEYPIQVNKELTLNI